MIFNAISLLLIIIAVVNFLDLTPKRISEDLMTVFNKKESLIERSEQKKNGRKKKSIGQKLIYVQYALTAMGKGDKFAFVICSSVVLFAAGVIFAMLINNVFLIPVFAVAFAIIPFVYVSTNMEHYEKHIKDELETTLSIITTSYVRNDDIIGAVEENLNYIKPPLREHFAAFIGDATFIADTKKAIINLKNKVDDDIYKEWCDALIQCQDDSTLKDTLQPIIAKLSDVRIVNNELSSMMSAVRMEYYAMVGLVVGNIPLLYLLNKDWFHTLMFELPGKITLGICGAVILVTYLFMLKFTRPVEFKG